MKEKCATDYRNNCQKCCLKSYIAQTTSAM